MTTTQAALIDALKECRQFLEDMHVMSPEWTIEKSQPLHAKLTDILAAANAAPTERAKQTMEDILTHGMSITRIDPASIYDYSKPPRGSEYEITPEEARAYLNGPKVDFIGIVRKSLRTQAAPVLDATGEREYERGFNDGQEKVDVFRQRALKAEAVCVALSLTIAEDEPVAHVDLQSPGPGDRLRWTDYAHPHGTALYTRPQPKELPVLSDDEMERICTNAGIAASSQITSDQTVSLKNYRRALVYGILESALLSRKPADGGKP